MNSFENFLVAIQYRLAEEPSLFGAFHICCLIIMVALAAFLVIRYKDADEKVVRRIFFIAWIVMVVSEIYKQLVFSFDANNLEWDYLWYAFPFQFCSSPMFVLPFIVFMKDCKFRSAAMAYMTTFSFFGGLVTMIYTEQVYIPILGINIQTMLHHGLQVVLGVFLVARNRHRLNKRFFAWAILVFLGFVGIAMLLNEGVYQYLITNYSVIAGGDEFNMFYISRHFDCTLPILDGIYKAVPYPVFLVIYVLGFTLIAAVIYAIDKLMVAMAHAIKAAYKKIKEI
jgi:hypothetical protein